MNLPLYSKAITCRIRYVIFGTLNLSSLLEACSSGAFSALSSCEAEIVAASEATKEAIYVKSFLSELGLHDEDAPVSMECDNQAAIDTAYNPENHDRMKHVDRRHFFVREKIEDGELVVPYVRSEANLADFFTKPLSGARFFELRDRIMNCDARSARALRVHAT